MPGRILASPAYADGVFVVADDEGMVVGVDGDGQVLWRFRAPYPVLSSPLVSDGRAYVLSSEGNLFCLDLQKGGALWQYTRKTVVKNPVWGGAQVCAGAGKVYLGSSDGFVLALDALTGALRWQREISRGALFPDVVGGPTLDDGKIYAASREGPCYCLDAASGDVLWQKSYGAVSGFAVGEELLVMGTAQGGVRAVRKADGAEVWTTALDGGIATLPVLAGGEVVVGSSEGSLLALDARTGARLKSFLPGRGLEAQPWVGPEGLILLGNGGTLCRVKRPAL
jgi:outer membrane protein assembly factor BamB